MTKKTKPGIGVYGEKTRNFQRKLTSQLFSLTFKEANVYRYLGSRENVNPDINDIQTKVFYEVPDRAYDSDTVSIRIGMEPMQEQAMDFSRFGLINPMQGEQTFRVHLDDFECLGRWLIIGDVFEIPFFKRDCERAFWEITDVDDKPAYERYYVSISAVPLKDSRQSREIPIDRSNTELIDNLMNEQDDEQQSFVDYEGVVAPDEEEPTNEVVDYRRSTQKSFLDDPNKTFNNEDA